MVRWARGIGWTGFFIAWLALLWEYIDGYLDTPPSYCDIRISYAGGPCFMKGMLLVFGVILSAYLPATC